MIHFEADPRPTVTLSGSDVIIHTTWIWAPYFGPEGRRAHNSPPLPPEERELVVPIESYNRLMARNG
jgi:hypothetical protein